jgi:hypothetical protein
MPDTLNLTISSEDLKGYNVGDIISLGDNNYKLVKKTTTAVAIERYYFWNKWFDKLFKGAQ